MCASNTISSELVIVLEKRCSIKCPSQPPVQRSALPKVGSKTLVSKEIFSGQRFRSMMISGR